MDYNDDKFILAGARALVDAQMRSNVANRPTEVQVLNLDLSKAKSADDPLQINLTFRSIFVRDASDTNTQVFLRPISRDTTQEPFSMNKNDSFVMPMPIAGFLHWDAQPGKTMKIILYATGEFRSGSQISQNGGGVSINEGSSASMGTVSLVAAAAAVAIAPSNLNRKTALIQNNVAGDIYVGADNTVTAATGIRIAAGQQFAWRNTAALFGFSAAAGAVVRLEET